MQDVRRYSSWSCGAERWGFVYPCSYTQWLLCSGRPRSHAPNCPAGRARQTQLMRLCTMDVHHHWPHIMQGYVLFRKHSGALSPSLSEKCLLIAPLYLPHYVSVCHRLNNMESEVPAIRDPEGVLYSRVPTNLTFPSTAESPTLLQWRNPSLPPIDAKITRKKGSIARAVESRLREHCFQHPDPHSRRFWPPRLILHLLDRSTIQQIVQELVEEGKLEDLRQDWTGKICGSNETAYRRVFGILLLTGKEDLIGAFIDRGMADEDLPLIEAVFISPTGRTGIPTSSRIISGALSSLSLRQSPALCLILLSTKGTSNRGLEFLMDILRIQRSRTPTIFGQCPL